MEEKEKPEGKEQNIKETQQVNMQEVRILKQFRHLPNVFMIRTKYGQVIKISIIKDNFVDCEKYISRSKLTFNGCFKYQNNQLAEVRGIYYTPVASILSIYSRNKITRDMDHIKNIILNTLANHGLANSKLLIVYDNYTIEIYDRYKKSSLLEFSQIAEQGHLEIFSIPLPKYIRSDEFEIVRNIQIYNHTLETNVDIKVYHPYSSPGLAYLLYVPEFVTIRVSSPDHDEKTVDLYSGQYYLIAHPAPIHKVD